MILLGSLVAGLVGAAILLWRWVDVDSLLEAATNETPPAVEEVVADVALPGLPATAAWSAHLYESESSAGFFPDPGYYGRNLDRWELLLDGIGAGVGRISRAADLDSVHADDLLVIPAAVCLSDSERQAIRRYVERGGHLLVTWALGARDEMCRWLGYDFLRDVTGAETAGTLEGEPPSYLTVPHGSVVATGLPPGSRIELKTEPWITLRADASVVFWSDWALNPLPAPRGGAGGGALVRKLESGGRLAWFGYRLDVAAGAREERIVERLAQNAALWAAGHVLASVEPWPGGHRAAMAVTQDVEHSFKNSRRLARRLMQLEVPGTFFVVTRLALERQDLAAPLMAAGEIGSHSADHRQIAGRPWGTQTTGMTQARADLAAWSGRSPLGLRPPRELFDSVTLEAWRRTGGTYVAAANGARSAAPEIHEVESGAIVVLPRVVDDDYAVIVTRGQTRPDSLRAAFEGALEKTRWLGGLDLLTVHTQLIDSERRVDAIEAAVRSALEAGDVWIASGSEIAEWWLRRSQIALRVHERADRSAVLTVAVLGSQSVESAWLHVHLPEDRSTYAAPEMGDIILESHYGPWGLRVRLPELTPGEAIDILIPRR
jgi:peptidoglycan/xylan/chitin deacetylase (PgdA/CDA1 family)